MSRIVDPDNVRATAQPDGGAQCQIEIREAAGWVVVAGGISRRTAENIIKQASNRVILG